MKHPLPHHPASTRSAAAPHLALWQRKFRLALAPVNLVLAGHGAVRVGGHEEGDKSKPAALRRSAGSLWWVLRLGSHLAQAHNPCCHSNAWP